MSRRSNREVRPSVLPHGLQCLFHNNDQNPNASLSKKLIKLHSDPCVYLVNDFLTESELEYLDRNITQYKDQFQESFTENEEGKKVISEERTSTYIFLEKGHDVITRNIESRAADLVSLGADFVEPLQIVSYKGGQRFDLHHDAGTMLDDGSIEMVYPRRYPFNTFTLFIFSSLLL